MTGELTRRLVILGFPRSGTTLLARLLDGHPDISAPPETGLLSAAGRFLAELTNVEGPPIGVITGLGFAGIDAEEIYSGLRNMVFGFSDRIAAGRKVWVEKTATDLFHLERLEPMLVGHARFICLTRNPLDVIPSNIDLARTMGAQLPELFALTRESNSEYDGIARAWINRQTVLDGFADRHAADCFKLRYEDLLASPEKVLGDILQFAGLAPGLDFAPTQMIAAAFSDSARIGLGDFKINETSGLRPMVENAWRKRIPRAVASRIIPELATMLNKHNYPVPKVPPVASRDTAMRQFEMAARLKRQSPSAVK
jgi:Sulfotransferase family